MQEKLEQYAKMLFSWNQIHSLSGAKDMFEIQKNIKSSLYPLQIKELKLEQKKLLLDVGSGNGFPAIPLGIMLGIKTILCEPNAKKVAFLQNLKAELDLKNFVIMRKKVESLELDNKPDLITSRAVFSTEVFLQKCKGKISKDSLIILYKGQSVADEIPPDLIYSSYNFEPFTYLVILGGNLC